MFVDDENVNDDGEKTNCTTTRSHEDDEDENEGFDEDQLDERSSTIKGMQLI